MIGWVIFGLGIVGFGAVLRWIGKSSTEGVYDDETNARTKYVRLRYPSNRS